MRGAPAPFVIAVVAMLTVACVDPAASTALASPEGQSRALTASIVLTSTEDFESEMTEREGVDVVGGAIVRASLFPNVSSWSAGVPLPSGRRGHGMVRVGTRLYVLGGCLSLVSGNNCGPYTADVHAADIDPATGGPSSWVPMTPLPSGREWFGAVASAGFIYAVGGRTGAGALTEVLVSRVAEDGTLGPWNPTTPLPLPRAQFGLAVHRGSLYVVGGAGDAGLRYADVLRAEQQPDGTLGAWQTTSPLPFPRAHLPAVVVAGRLYALGGFAAVLGSLPDVYVSDIAPDGSLSPWRATTPLVEPIDDMGAVAVGGHIGVFGGYNSGLGQRVTAVRFAPVFPDGTLGAWQSGPPLTTEVESPATVEVNGRILVSGGKGSAAGTTDAVQIASLTAQAPASAELLPFAAGPPLPSPLMNTAAVVDAHTLYVMGGCTVGALNGDCTTRTASVIAAALDPVDGGFSTGWSTVGALPAARDRHEGAVWNGRLLVVSGRVNGAGGGMGVPDVLVSSSDAGTSIDWDPLPISLPGSRAGHIAAVSDGRLWVIGGQQDLLLVDDVQVAQLHPDGGASPFTTAGTFAGARMEHEALLLPGELIVMGGWNGSASLSDVQRAPVMAGAAGTFTDAGVFPGARAEATAVVSAGHVWLMGGAGASGPSDSIFVAPLLPEGGLGPWRTHAPLPSPRYRHAAVADGRNVVVLGGVSSAGTSSSVAFSRVRAATSKGIHARRIDLGREVTLSTLQVDGTLAPAGEITLEYRVASASGPYSAWSSLGAVPLGTAVPVTDPDVRYLELRVGLDDSRVPRPDAVASVATHVDEIVVTFDDGMDGGVDAGEADGGAPQDGGEQADAGEPVVPDSGDGGFSADLPPAALAVSCGCDAASGTAGVALGFALMVLSRSRRTYG